MGSGTFTLFDLFMNRCGLLGYLAAPITTRVVWLVETNRLGHYTHVPWGGIRVV